MTQELRDRFLELDGYWIPRKDIEAFGPDGVFLKDGRHIRREP